MYDEMPSIVDIVEYLAEKDKPIIQSGYQTAENNIIRPKVTIGRCSKPTLP